MKILGKVTSTLVLLLTLITTSIIAQENTLDENFKDYEISTFDSRSLISKARSKSNDFINIPFKLNKHFKWNLELTADKVFSEDYVLNVGGSVTQRNSLKLPMVLRGYDEKTNAVRAVITINDDFLYGTIETSEERIYFEPLSTFDPSASPDQIIIYKQSDVLDNDKGTCAVAEIDRRREQLHFSATEDEINNRSMGPCRQLDLAIANEHNVKNGAETDQDVINFNAGVMANVNTDYDDAFNDEIRFVIVETYISQSASQNTWGSSSNAGTLLDNFTDWGPNGFNNTHDLGSLWTGTDFDGSTIGLAWVGVVCGSNRYHVLQRYSSNASGLRNLVSHEIGHNFNLGHYDPQPYDWIMSPSVSGASQWHPSTISDANSYISTIGCLSSCSGGGGGTPPVANFNGDIVNECDPLQVQFNDLSSNTPTMWSWQFENGSPGTSNQQNPIITFPGNGNYRVTLTATNGDGSDQQIYTMGLTDVGNPPNASFTSSVSGFTATFDNNTTNANTYSWAFGDGQTSNGANPSHTYAATGTYSVTLTAVGDCGTDTDIRTVTITDQVTAEFTSNTTSICFGEQVTYTNQSSSNATTFSWQFEGGSPSTSSDENPTVSYNGAGTFNVLLTVSGGGTSDGENKSNFITVSGEPNASFTTSIDGYTVDFNNNTPNGISYSWAFGDGQNSSAPNPSHTYSSAGTYNVTLTSSNDCGTDDFVQQITIADEVVADFIADVTSGCAGSTFEFTSTSSGNITDYLWEFSDGTPSTSTDENPSVVFNSPGNKAVKLTVSNSLYNDSKNELSYISITAAPNARFDFVVNESTVTFDNNTPNGISYFWDFGDGTTSEEPNPTHTYSSGGDYEVTLSSENDCEVGEITKTITIDADIIARFTASDTEICPGENISYSNSSEGSIVSYLWEFEGGTPSTSTAENPTVSYAQGGSFNVKLTVSDGANTDVENKQNHILVNVTPLASFNHTINGYVVNLTNNSEDASDYLWSFGDGGSSTSPSPTYTYNAPGTYTINLLASNDCDENESVKTIEIIEVLIADFELSSSEICEGTSIQYNDVSEGDIATYAWEFQGGSPATSSLENPEVSYSASGTYDAKLTITSTFGTIKNKIREVVVASGPSADFSYIQNELTFTFTNLSENGNSVLWNFGDGSTSSESNPTHTYVAEDNYTVVLTVNGDCGQDEMEIDLPVFNQLLANFMAAETDICAGQEIELIDLSSGNPTEWEWNIVGEEMINVEEQNPTIILEEAGEYTVELIVRNSEEEDSKTIQQYIEVLALPESTFDYGFDELEVTFTNKSENGESFFWDFGDGTTSAEANPVHGYEIEGDYVVMLRVINECSTEESEQTLSVFNRLVVGFKSDEPIICTATEIQFTDQSSGNADSWNWSFPGGTPSVSTEQNPKVIYSEAGEFDVILRVNSETEEITETKSQYVSVSKSTVADYEYTIDKNIVTFTNASENADDYYWTFQSSEENPVFEFAEEKAYDVTLFSSNGCSMDKKVKTIDLYEEANTYANLGIESSSYCLGEEISFIDLSSEDIIEWNWKFPGGTPSQSVEKNPSVVYEEFGTFDVELTVSNGFNVRTIMFEEYISVLAKPVAGFEIIQENASISLVNSATSYSTIKWYLNGVLLTGELSDYLFAKNGEYEITQVVSNACAEDEISQSVIIDVFPTAGFSLNGTKGCAPFTINFESKFTDSNTDVTWFLEGSDLGEYNGLNPEVIYNDPGTYGVTVVATNEFGSDTITLNNVIEVIELPEIDFEYEIENSNVLFTALVGEHDKLVWDFGDGSTSDQVSVSHMYDELGIYEVTLTSYYGTCVSEFSQDVALQTSDVDDLDEFESFKIFPNPANEFINIEFSEVGDVEQIEIIDQLGRRIWIEKVIKGAEKIVVQGVSRFNPGQYFVALTVKGMDPIFRKVLIFR